MKVIAVVFLSLVALFVSPNFLLACTCVGETTQHWLARNDRVIFEGEVLRVDRVQEEGRTVQRIVFKVTKGWKNADSSEITVWIPGVGECCDCTKTMQKGSKFLVDAGPVGGNRLYTTICSFTGPLASERSQQLIRELEQTMRRGRN